MTVKRFPFDEEGYGRFVKKHGGEPLDVLMALSIDQLIDIAHGFDIVFPHDPDYAQIRKEDDRINLASIIEGEYGDNYDALSAQIERVLTQHNDKQ